MPDNDQIAIRAATRADESVLLKLAGRLTDFELPPWRTSDEIVRADGQAMLAAVAAGHPDEEVLLAERDGAGVGCLHVLAMTDFFGQRHAHISVIATTREAEGSGVGRALMEQAERWARQRGLSLLTLHVFAGNVRALRFYDGAGFTPEILKYAKSLY
jgi:ribosomal protein S18 acetylase RimI-like enzyme